MVFFENVLGQGCVLSVIPGRPPEVKIEDRRRLRTNGPLVIGFRSADPAMTAARGFIWEMSARGAQRIERLSLREKEVFEDLVVGHSNRVIADKLGISPRTVEFRRAAMPRARSIGAGGCPSAAIECSGPTSSRPPWHGSWRSCSIACGVTEPTSSGQPRRRRLRRNNVPECREGGSDVPVATAASARPIQALRGLE